MKLVNTFIKALGLAVVLIVFQLLVSSPWWLFVVPTFVIGAVLPKSFWNRKSFAIGFLAGFLLWVVPMLHYEVSFEGNASLVLSELISVPYWLLVVAVGCIGGILTGLALVSGAQLRTGKEEMKLEL